MVTDSKDGWNDDVVYCGYSNPAGSDCTRNPPDDPRTIWEADFSTHSYGFRPNRSTYDAMTYIGKRLASSAGQAYQWVIEGDIASYFDYAS